MRWVLVVIGILANCESGAAADETAGFTPLLDGKSLAGWINKTEDGQPNPDNKWTVKEGVLTATPGTGWLSTKEMVGDFVLKLEWRVPENGNSGVFIRCADPAKIGAETCYEVNIWDIRPEPKYGTGAIVDHAAVPVPLVHKAGGRWNTYEITAKGTQLTVKLNGVQTVSIQDSKHASGPFALQYGPGVQGAQGGPIKWRKVQIRPL